MLLAITDSGLGGLSICAALEHNARSEMRSGQISARWKSVPTSFRMAYVNVWPEEGRGYNDFPDMESRAAVFDRALDHIAALNPDRLLIACNTLSIVYPLTRFVRTAPFPVHGIVDAGVSLFVEALAAEPESSIVLLGTRTTIVSRAHTDRLVAAGVDAARIVGEPCHGLATAIERDFDGPAVGELIAACGEAVNRHRLAEGPVYVGLCCTHYGYVAARISGELTRVLGRPVTALDPNVRMVQDVAGCLRGLAGSEGEPAGSYSARPAVEVTSKVVLDERTRRGVAGLVRPMSPATADALWAYRHVPTLF